MMRVWEGRDPRTGEIVVRRGATGDHVAGIDVTLSAPKSVSVLWALGEPQLRGAVEAAHERAVLTTLAHVGRRFYGNLYRPSVNGRGTVPVGREYARPLRSRQPVGDNPSDEQ